MKKILIIDDSESTRASIEFILRELEHEVTTVGDGKAGLKALESEGPFDLIITDIFMPEVDGIEFIEQAKAKFPDIRIIAMSAGGMGIKGAEMLDIASGLGAEKIVAKPFSNEEISSAVTSMLE